MKKINFRGLKETLSENQLKNILGGSGSGGEIICFQCGNGNDYACYCEKSDYDNCLDYVSLECPGGWMEWESGVTGPVCN